MKKQDKAKEKNIKKTTKKESDNKKETSFADRISKSKKEISQKNIKEGERKESRMVKEGSNRYIEAVGRRKTATARVRLFTQGEKEIFVNDKPYQIYFSTLENQKTITAPFEKINLLGRFRVLVKVKGGGINAQAEAIRHGISRALVKFNLDFKKRLRKAGFLTRDSRERERKKFGLKRARRAPQWQKR